MILIDILKRRDASSLIVAIIIATAVSQTLFFVIGEPAARLVGIQNGPFGASDPSQDWRSIYLVPIVTLALQLIALEVLARLTIAVRSVLGGTSKRKK